MIIRFNLHEYGAGRPSSDYKTQLDLDDSTVLQINTEDIMRIKRLDMCHKAEFDSVGAFPGLSNRPSKFVYVSFFTPDHSSAPTARISYLVEDTVFPFKPKEVSVLCKTKTGDEWR